ncbi:MAG: class I mannose-6-phosphate isomerase [Planctomycetes bacterium]|nr:class I mannose-6-phosphate isomerase [Planctomycetota bacterium]
MDLYPYKFHPIYKAKIWGGRNLERLFGRPLPEGQLIGESWELTDLGADVSVVAEGPLAGVSLTELTQRLGEKLLGRALPMPDGRFPLLLKFLDTNDINSLQVHPDRRAAAEIGGDSALKTECWYIVESRGGWLYKGVKPGVSAEQFRQAIEENKAQDLVVRHECKAGDFHYLPAGTVHAIGPGLVLAEIQTPSDSTYRVTDWGRGRPIHVEQSMRCIRFDLPGPTPGADGDNLLDTEYFSVAVRRGRGVQSPDNLGEGICQALMFTAGTEEFEITCGGIPTPTLAVAGDTVLIPAGCAAPKVIADESCRYLQITIPGRGAK